MMVRVKMMMIATESDNECIYEISHVMSFGICIGVGPKPILHVPTFFCGDALVACKRKKRTKEQGKKNEVTKEMRIMWE